MTSRATRTFSTVELAILLMTSPLFLFFRPAISPVLLLLPLLWWIRYRRRGHWIPRTPVDWPILGLMAMTLVSLLVTPDLNSSIDKVVGLLYAISVFYALVDWGQCQQSGLPVAIMAVVLAGATALFSLFGTQWNIKWSMMRGIAIQLPRVAGSLPGAESGFNPNTVSGTLIVFVPLQLCLLLGLASEAGVSATRRRWLLLTVGASLSLTILVVLLAQSRAAWAALLLGLISLAGIVVRRFHLTAALIITLVLVLLVVMGPVGAGEWLVQQGWMTRPATDSWAARTEVWSRAIWASAEFPLTGMGMDSFRQAAWKMYPFFHKPFGEDFGHAHNIFLQVTLDLGIPGLVSYLALFGGIIGAGWLSYRSSTHRMARLMALGGVLGLGTHAAWSLVDALPLGARTNFLWWTVAALIATIGTLDPPRAETEMVPSGPTDLARLPASLSMPEPSTGEGPSPG